MTRRSKRIKSKYALFKAISEADSPGDCHAITFYISKHDNPRSFTDCEGNGPLHLAIQYDKCDLVRNLLLLCNLRLDQANKEGYTPLHKSLHRSCESCLRALIHSGADVNQVNRKTLEVPLHLAARENAKYSKILIENGALITINARDTYGCTPLMVSAYYEKLENACLLLYYGADPIIECKSKYTPFMVSLASQLHELQEILLEYESDLNQPDKNCWNNLFWALIGRSPFIFEIIRRLPKMNYSRPVYEVLNICVTDNFVEIFELVLHQTTFASADSTIFFLIETALSHRRHAFLDLMIQSPDVLKYIIESHLIKYPIIFLLRWSSFGYSKQKLIHAVYVLLAEGFNPTMMEIEAIYMSYGYCDLFRALLLIEPSDRNVALIIPCIIYNVNMKTEDIIMYYIVNNLVRHINTHATVLLQFNVTTFFRFCTSEMFFIHYKCLCREILGIEVKVTPYRRIPSLQELSRNQVRYNIFQKYNIRNTCHFYTVLHNLPIPKRICDIIAFKVPLYQDVEVSLSNNLNYY